MSFPGIRVEVGFGATWQTEPASITWVDVTAYVLDAHGLSTMRGASAARGQVDAGSAGLSLLNVDRRFDPTYTAGPYYGNLKPGVPIQITCTASTDDLLWGTEVLTWGGETLVWGTPIPVWYGSVKKWPQRYDIGNTFAWMPVECWDGFADLARAKIPRSVLEAEILADSPVAYWKLDETTGTTMVDSSGNGHHGTYVAGTPALSGEAEADGGGRSRGITFDGEHSGFVQDSVMPTAKPIVIEFIASPTPDETWGVGTVLRGGDGTVGSSIVNAEFSRANANEQPYRWSITTTFAGAQDGVVMGDVDGFAIDDLSPHHIAVRIHASGRAGYFDGVAAFTGVATNSYATTVQGAYIAAAKRSVGSFDVPYPGFLSNVAIFDADIGAVRVLAHGQAAVAPLDNQTTDERITWVADQIDWPTNLRDLEPGDTTLGPATFKPGDKVLDYFRLIERTEDGRLFTGKDGKVRFLNRYWRYLNTLATVSQITFSDQNTGRGYAEFQLDLDDELLMNIARYTRRNGTEQVVSDATSVAAYGEAEDQQGDLLLRTDVEVRSLAQWKVATQSFPLPRVPSIRIPLHDYSAADQASVLGLDLGHRVTCNRTPQGVGSAISTAFLVDGIRHEINATEWWMTLYVSPVPAATAQVFILGTSTLSGPDILGY